MLVAISIEAFAFDGTRSLLNHDELTLAHVHSVHVGFETLPAAIPVLKTLFEGERVMVLEMAQQIARGRAGFLELIGWISSSEDEPARTSQTDEDGIAKLDIGQATLA